MKRLKKSKKRRIYAFLMVMVMFLSCSIHPTKADNPSRTSIGRSDHAFVELGSELSSDSTPPQVTAEAAILVDLETGMLLYEKNIHRRLYPASTTKVMTALIALERLDLGDHMTLSHNSTHDLIEGGFDERFKERMVFTVEECLYGLCLNSVNTLAYALAEKMAQTLPNFAALMNTRAREAGATNTRFYNPHGLNDSRHVTTVHDMAKILWEAIEIDDYRRIAGTYSFSCTDLMYGTEMVYNNTLQFLNPDSEWYDARVVCGKTGWTEDANFCRAVYASSDGRDLICVVFNSTEEEVENDVKKLLDYGFSFVSEGQTPLNTDYRIQDGYLTGVEPGTSLEDFQKKLNLPEGSSAGLTDAKGDAKAAGSLVQTGDRLTITNEKTGENSQLVVLIYGDTNGDGIIDIFDLVAVRNHIIKLSSLTGAIGLAGDVNRDEIIDIFDLVGIRNSIIKLAPIQQ